MTKTTKIKPKRCQNEPKNIPNHFLRNRIEQTYDIVWSWQILVGTVSVQQTNATNKAAHNATNAHQSKPMQPLQTNAANDPHAYIYIYIYIYPRPRDPYNQVWVATPSKLQYSMNKVKYKLESSPAPFDFIYF